MSTDLATRSSVFSASGRPTRTRVAGQQRHRATELRLLVGEALGVFADTLLPENPDEEFTAERLAGLARACVSEAQGLTGSDEPRARDLYLLALDLQQLALELHEEDLVQRNRRLRECADGLFRLRGLTSSRDLVDVVCQEIVNRCGFGRATISRVERGMWVPTKAHFAEDDETWFDDWIGQGIPLHGHTPETRLLTERRPALVLDTSQGEVHEDIIVEAGQSLSYVVAPLMSRGSVVGFLHCDHFPTTRRTDGVDRDVLWAFAEGFTRLHERMVLLERVQAQRAQVGAVLDAALAGLPDSLGTTLGGTSWGGSALAPSCAGLLAELTGRETEVLELMVAGRTNRAIADQLVIAEDTVKSHVKQVLRKLGVSNRAQAIARAAGTAPA